MTDANQQINNSTNQQIAAQRTALLETAKHLATSFASRAEQHDREGSFPFENFDELRDAGFLALALPRDLGGRGLSIYDF